MLVCSFRPRAGLVASRQTFVRRRHRPTIFTSCCKLNCKAQQERDQRRKGGGSRATDYMRG